MTEKVAHVPIDPEAEQDLVDVLSRFTNFIGNERVRAYNEGVDAQAALHPGLVQMLRDALKEYEGEEGGPADPVRFPNHWTVRARNFLGPGSA